MFINIKLHRDGAAYLELKLRIHKKDNSSLLCNKNVRTRQGTCYKLLVHEENTVRKRVDLDKNYRNLTLEIKIC